MKYLLLVSLSSLLFFTCTKNNIAGNSTQSGNPSVTAMVYNPGGSPAAHARVRFYPVHYNPRTGTAKALAAVVESTTTDANGNYSAKLDTGAYNVLGASDSGVVYQDSIVVIKDSTVHPPTDTLKAPGGIRGRVRLQPGDDARTVFIIFMGTSTLNMPDDSIGRFTVANMAEGTYRVRFLTTLDAYVPKDTVLSVMAGKVDSLTHDIVLQYTGIPVPSGLTIRYDTLKQIATLGWNKPTTGRKVAGYNIYRKQQDSGFVRIKSDWADTVYNDSALSQDSTYVYRVSAVDTNGTEGVNGPADSVRVVSAFSFSTEIGNGIGIGPGKFASLQDIIVDSQGRLFAADANANPNKIWVFDTSGILIDSVGSDSGAGVVNRVRKLGLKGDSLLDVAQGNKAQVFDAQNNFVGLIGGTGSGDSIFTSDELLGITFANSFYYIVDNRDIKMFTDSLSFVKKFAGLGTGQGQIGPSETPANIGFDSVGNIILVVGVGSSQSRLLKFSPAGVYISDLVIPHQILDFRFKNGLLYFVVNDALGQKGIFIFMENGTLYGKVITAFFPNCITIAGNGTAFVGSSDDGKIRKLQRK